MEVTKQQLFARPLSADAIRLAKAIYFTCISEDTFSIKINIKRLCELFGINSKQEVVHKTTQLLEELNEPLAVKNFTFNLTTYPVRFIKFCTYTWEKDKLLIELDKEYLYAHDHYMLEPFLK